MAKISEAVLRARIKEGMRLLALREGAGIPPRRKRTIKVGPTVLVKFGSPQARDSAFAMIGREAPLDIFRRSGVHIHGEWRVATWAGFVAFFALCFWLYHWK